MRDGQDRAIHVDPCVRIAVDMDQPGTVPPCQRDQPMTACREISLGARHPFEAIGRLLEYDVRKPADSRALRRARRRSQHSEDETEFGQGGAQGQRVVPHPADGVGGHQHGRSVVGGARHHPGAISSSARRRGRASWISLKLE